METFFPRGYITKEKEVFPIPKKRKKVKRKISPFRPKKSLRRHIFFVPILMIEKDKEKVFLKFLCKRIEENDNYLSSGVYLTTLATSTTTVSV